MVQKKEDRAAKHAGLATTDHANDKCAMSVVHFSNLDAKT